MNKFFTEMNSDKPKGNINIAKSSHWSVNFLPKIIDVFLREYPEGYLKMHHCDPEEIENLVAAGHFEIGLIETAPRKKELEFIAGPALPFVIVGKPQPRKNWDDLSYIVFKDRK